MVMGGHRPHDVTDIVRTTSLNEFECEVVKCPSMSWCGFVSVDIGFIILIHVDSFNDYDHVYRKELSILPYVARIRSSFVMRQVSRRSNPPVLFEGVRR